MKIKNKVTDLYSWMPGKCQIQKGDMVKFLAASKYPPDKTYKVIGVYFDEIFTNKWWIRVDGMKTIASLEFWRKVK